MDCHDIEALLDRLEHAATQGNTLAEQAFHAVTLLWREVADLHEAIGSTDDTQAILDHVHRLENERA